MITLANARVVTPLRVIEPGWIVIDNGRIHAVGRAEPPATDGHVVDLALDYVLPGFIDLHMHGGAGAQVTSIDPDEILRAVTFHRSHGTTRTLLSLVTSPIEDMVAAARTIADMIHSGDLACRSMVGIHLEGPFLNPLKPGSHHTDHILAPDPAALRHLLAAGDGTVRSVTLAPELPGGMDLLREVVAYGAVASVGHTDATHRQTTEAFAAGARLVTHLFNAMREFHHREPGTVGAALADDSVTCELINDGHHVHDDVTRLVLAAAGHDRIAFITDATPAAGMGNGSFKLGPLPVQSRDGKVTLLDGVTHAGSTLTMDAAVRHAVRCVGIPITHAATAAASTPARVLGLDERTGSIQPGKDADLVVLDQDLRIRAVIAEGVVVHGLLPGSR
ncbi:N-acetylglucosamine-6-phosphate deacetylase [Dactylosporangium sp. NPDC050588]|uniref:N-acetylglucosamine-6-phosphate deacetylase n=1 Tax=Dactylosporangium sp. NPDC050588 TaxID=3157211 RepID=UPI0033E64663